MPVLDQKPISEDYDDEHHSRLLERQHKNDNDALPTFASSEKMADHGPMGQ